MLKDHYFLSCKTIAQSTTNENEMYLSSSSLSNVLLFATLFNVLSENERTPDKTNFN